MARKLTVVPPGERAKPAEPTTVRAAADSSRRALLVALRSHFASELDKGAVPAHALASVGAKIDEFDRGIRAIDLMDAQEAASAGQTEDEDWSAI